VVGRSHDCARSPGAEHWNVGHLFRIARSTSLTAEAGQPARWFALDALPDDRPRDLDVVVRHLLHR
jgi:hypothetical protein